MELDEGAMACGEFGTGRLPEPFAVWRRIAKLLAFDPGEEELPVLVDEADQAEVPESEDSGLGGLSASLITRGKKRADPLEGLLADGEFEDLVQEPAGEDMLPEEFAEGESPSED